MSRGTNQKFKFTYLMKIMLAKTDDEHALTMPQIMEELEKYELNSSYVNWAISADNTVGGCPLFAFCVKKHKWQKNGGIFNGQHFG